jgi:hypothetical protein
MAKTLFDISYQLARALGVVSEGIATGGSTGTIIDTVERTEADDFWNGGSAWILYDSAGLGAAPQGEYGYISDFVSSTGTATIRTALTTAVASGDRYAIAGLRYPLQLLTQKINEVVGGVIEKVDTSTVVIVADQTEYSLPSDVLELKEVWIQTNTDDTNDNRWERLYDWDTQKSATGTANKLILARQFTADDVIKIRYLTYHAKLQAATDKLDDSIHIDKVVYNAAVLCLEWRQMKVGQSDDLSRELNFFQALAERANNEHPIDLPKRSAKTIHPIFSRP